jgi:hypothetical protein
MTFEWTGATGRIMIVPTGKTTADFHGEITPNKHLAERWTTEGKGELVGDDVVIAFKTTSTAGESWTGEGHLQINSKSAMSGYYTDQNRKYDVLDMRRAP